ncbi:MAG: PilZ domain-containing protein [Steroidobacteraceae bacterium]
MYEGLDTIVLYDELAYEDVVPVQWLPLGNDLTANTVASYSERNLRVLQSLVALEEHGQLEKATEDNLPHAADLARLDKKMNLLLDLVGHLLSTHQQRPPSVPVRFNTLGASWKNAKPLAVGDQGVLEIYVRECIPEPLRLAGRVVQAEPTGKAKLRFIALGDSINDLLSKLAFRRHRRSVAEQKHPRR